MGEDNSIINDKDCSPTNVMNFSNYRLKRKRKRNFSFAETNVLLTLVEQNSDLILSTDTCATTNYNKTIMWKIIAEQLSKSGVHRVGHECKARWQQMASKVRTEANRYSEISTVTTNTLALKAFRILRSHSEKLSSKSLVNRTTAINDLDLFHDEVRETSCQDNINHNTETDMDDDMVFDAHHTPSENVPFELFQTCLLNSSTANSKISGIKMEGHVPKTSLIESVNKLTSHILESKKHQSRDHVSKGPNKLNDSDKVVQPDNLLYRFLDNNTSELPSPIVNTNVVGSAGTNNLANESDIKMEILMLKKRKLQMELEKVASETSFWTKMTKLLDSNSQPNINLSFPNKPTYIK